MRKAKAFSNNRVDKIEQKKIFEVLITKTVNFIKISGDNSPIHTSKKFSIKHGYKKTMCHGFLLSVILSNILEKNFRWIRTLC